VTGQPQVREGFDVAQNDGTYEHISQKRLGVASQP
jgi:hypothetical protein